MEIDQYQDSQITVNYAQVNVNNEVKQHIIYIKNGVKERIFTKFANIEIYFALPKDQVKSISEGYFGENSGRKIIERRSKQSTLVSLLDFEGIHFSKEQRDLLNSFIPVTPIED